MANDFKEKIVIVGYGGHAKSISDSIKASGKYEICGYTDLCENKTACISYLGNDDSLSQIFKEGVHFAAIGIGFMGDSNIRDRKYEQLKTIGYELPVIIDPSAIVADDAEIGEGTFIGKRAVINAAAKVGRMCIINTGAIIEHEDIVGDYTHIAVGSILCGQVRVGNHVFIGAGSTVIQCKEIGDNSFIGARSVVVKNVKNNTIARNLVRGAE